MRVFIESTGFYYPSNLFQSFEASCPHPIFHGLSFTPSYWASLPSPAKRVSSATEASHFFHFTHIWSRVCLGGGGFV